MEERHPHKQPRIPHFYQKGKTLYYRVIIPRNAVDLPSGKEISVSLLTCRVKEARRIITLLHAHFLLRIAEMEKSCGMDGNRANHLKTMKKIKDELAVKVDASLRGTDKVLLSQTEIKQRLLALLIRDLENDEFEPGERYDSTRTGPDGKVTKIGEEEIWGQVAKDITEQADGWDFTEDLINVTILELINESIIKKEEATSENLLYLTKMAKVFEGYYYRILSARRSSDFCSSFDLT